MKTTTRRSGLWPRLLIVAALAAAAVVLPSSARAADDYPYRGHDPSELDERGFYYQHCTSFVAWRLGQQGPFHNYMNGGHWWHARNWAENAQRLGFAVDTDPARGAVAHWYAGEGGADSLGHVAIVDSVNADGSVMVEEYNGTSPLAYSRRGPIRAPRYIHVYDLAPPAPDPEPEPEPEPQAVEVPAPVHVVTRTDEVSVPSEVTIARAGTDLHRGPGGEITSPEPDARLHSGSPATVIAELTDYEDVARVDFFAADASYRWKLIGSETRGEGGRYSIEWTVDHPSGSFLSIYAAAVNAEGGRMAGFVRGLEGLSVIDAVSSSAEPHEWLTGTVSTAGAATSPSTEVAMAGTLMLAALLSARRTRRRADA